jgi:putative addiction module killer protein/probable addiction module antidote protein
LPFDEWLRELRDPNAVARVLARIGRVRRGNLGDCKPVGEGVSELRVDYGPGYRVYFGQRGSTLVILLCGGDKRTQDRDIRQAQQYWDDYRQRESKRTMKAAVRFETVLKDHLSDPEQAAKYLTACYEEGSEAFLQALRDVVNAQGGMSRTARLAGLNRESLYRQLSRRGNPSLSSLNAVLTALRLKLRFAAG